MTRRRARESKGRDGFYGESAAVCPACGKYAYTTRASARKATLLYPSGGRRRAYQCSDTDWWHLTSQDAVTAARHRAASAGNDPPA